MCRRLCCINVRVAEFPLNFHVCKMSLLLLLIFILSLFTKSSTIYRHACKSMGLFVRQQLSSVHVGAGMLMAPIYAPSFCSSRVFNSSLLNYLYSGADRTPFCLTPCSIGNESDGILSHFTLVVTFVYRWWRISQRSNGIPVQNIFLIKELIETVSNALCPSRVTT